MKAECSPALILLESQGAVTVDPLRETIQWLAKNFEVESLSGVYRHSAYTGLLLAVRIQTEHSPEKLDAHLRRQIAKSSQQYPVQATILMLGDGVFVTPQLTVPSPKLVESVEALSLACEIGGDLLHPILGKPLSHLLEQHPSSQWGEFFTRGKSLLPPSS